MPRERSGDNPRIKKYFKFLEYLKNNTDKNNPVTQEKIQKALGNDTWRDNRSFKNAVSDMMIVLNDESCNNFRIITDNLFEELETDCEIDNDGDKFDFETIYYNHIFSEEEVNSIINAIMLSKFIEPDEAKKLIEKIKTNLTSVHSSKKYSVDKIEKTNEVTFDRKTLAKNLNKIIKAIENDKKIIMKFYGYAQSMNLKISYMHNISPYYIITYNGKYYLIAIRDSDDDENPPTMMICRIDLMQEINLTEEIRVPVENVKGFPQKVDDRFLRQHYNMSYDEPIEFTLKIRTKWLTFLYDAFGKTAIVSKIENEENTYNVELKCSPFGMMSFAMQYSDMVEIVSPKKYRDEIKQRLEKLLEKYNK